MIEYTMPSLGADMESGFLREWHVKPGDTIRKGDIIAEVETQKGIIEIEIFEEGTIHELLVKVNDQVPVGTVMATIVPPGEEATATSPTLQPNAMPAAAQEPEAKTSSRGTLTSAGNGHAEEHHIRASPLAKKIATEKGIDISTLHGTGPEGAITREDVENALIAQMAPEEIKQVSHETAVVQPETAKKETEKERVADTTSEKYNIAPSSSTDSIRAAVAAAMSKSNKEVPHYYLETRIDMSTALKWLSEANKQRTVKERLLPAVLLIKAVAKALADVPDLNAWWENGLQRKSSVNVGYVVALRPGGIMVPAIHDADYKSLDELMLALNDLVPRARALRLRSSELSDSTITLTNLGEAGVETVYGVIYPPQVAIVGFGGITEQPWAENGMLAVRPVITVSLAADHRATDGSTGSRFLTAIKTYLQEPDKL